MIHATKSREAKLLQHLSVIFKGLDFSIEHGIYFVNVQGRDEKRDTSRFNVAEASIVGFFKNTFNSKFLIAKSIEFFNYYSHRSRRSW